MEVNKHAIPRVLPVCLINVQTSARFELRLCTDGAKGRGVGVQPSNSKPRTTLQHFIATARSESFHSPNRTAVNDPTDTHASQIKPLIVTLTPIWNLYSTVFTVRERRNGLPFSRFSGGWMDGCLVWVGMGWVGFGWVGLDWFGLVACFILISERLLR